MKYPLVLLILLIFTGCGERKVSPIVEKNSAVQKALPDQESWNTKVVFTRAGKVRAVLFANHLRLFEKKNLTLLDGVKLEFFNEKHRRTSVLTSKRGKVNESTKNMFAYDSVVARNDSGFVLRTDFLEWKNKAQKIVTDRFVTIDNKNEHIEGFGFEADEDLKNYVIHKVTYETQK